MIRKFLSFLLVTACLSPCLAVTKNKEFQIYSFSKGIDTYHSPTAIPEGYVQDAQNILFDDLAPASKRLGYSVAFSTKSYSYTGLWTYTDQTNTSWLIARSSDQITANNLAGTMVVISTISAANAVGETNAFGNAYFVDQTQGVYYWNGTSTTYVSGSPKGSIITQFHNRLWVTGAAVPNGNQLYGSAYYSGSVWTTGLNATDPVQYSVGLQDNFENTTAEYVYLDTLYIFKHASIFALYGFDQTNFQISQLTQECGCIDGNTIQTYNSGLKFVSLRGIENFNGYSCQRISDSIKNKVDPAIQVGGYSQQSWVQSQQSDWNSGTFSPVNSLNSSVSSPALVLSTGTIGDTTVAGFSSGTFVNTGASGLGGVLLNFNNSGTVTNPGCEVNDGGTGCQGWTNVGVGNWGQTNSFGGTPCTVFPRSGSAMFGAEFSNSFHAPYTLTVYAKNASNGSVLSSVQETINSALCSWTLGTVPGNSSYAGIRFYLEMDYQSATGPGVLPQYRTSDTYIYSGGPINFYYNSDSQGSWDFFAAVFVDDISQGSSTITTGSFTSQIFDTKMSSAAYQLSFNANYNTEPITMDLKTSTSPTGQFVETLASTSSIAIGNRYAIYTATFTVGSGDNALTLLTGATAYFTASTGTFISQIHNVGAINSWGNFSVQDTLNDGNISFYVCGSTNSNMGYPTSCSTQIPNSQILISTKTYVQWVATFTVTAATQTPTLQSGTVQWFSGNAQVPMASTVWDNRYWLSLTTTTTDTSNDAVLVLNPANSWTSFDIHAGAFSQYKNSLYHADSLPSGKVYLDNQGTSDNGKAINAYLVTRNESLADLTSDDYFYALYPSATSSGACPMSIQYTVDSSTSSYSLASPLLSEFNTISSVRLPFPIDSAHQDFGQTINFKVGTNDSTCSWQFIGLEGLYKSRPLQ